MPTATYIALANTTISGNPADITFSSIPATYRDLVCVVSGSTDATRTIFLNFNGDSSTYSTVFMEGNGTTASSEVENTTSALIGRFSSSVNSMIFHVMDYMATDKHKTVLSRMGVANLTVRAYAARWANTNAITSVKITVNGGTFSSGTTLSLYGIAS
jgi:hypothetical protein